jgi:hypothetical protein
VGHSPSHSGRVAEIAALNCALTSSINRLCWQANEIIPLGED